MGSSLPCLCLMVSLIIYGVTSAPVDSKETNSDHKNVTLSECDKYLASINKTESEKLALSDNDEEDKEMMKHMEELVSIESTTIDYMTTEIKGFDDEEETETSETIDDDISDSTDTLSFKHDDVDLSIPTAESSSILEEHDQTESPTSLSTEGELKSESLPLREVTDSMEGNQDTTAAEMSSVLYDKETSLEHSEGEERADYVENFTTEIPKSTIERDTASSPADKESTIREISIILLPLEDREDYDSDTDVEKIVSLFEIGGDAYEVEEIKNSSQVDTSSTISSSEIDTTDTAAFNAAKIREKLRTSSTSPSTTTAATITTESTTAFSTSEDTTTTVSSTTIISTTTEEPQTLPSTDETDVDTFEEKSDRVESTIADETTTIISTTTDAITFTSTTADSSSTTIATTTTDSSIVNYSFIDDSRYISGNNTDMVAAVQFLHYHDKASSEQCYKLVNSHWNYATNLTEENKKKQLAQTLEYSQFHKEAWKNATAFAWRGFKDVLLRRWFKSLSVLGTAALSDETLTEFNKLKAEMKNIYSTAKVCGFRLKPESGRRRRACALSLEPDLQRIMTKSRDYDELVHVWKSWRDTAGKPIRQKYLKFVEISNEAAHLNGFKDTGDMWRESYESVTFREDLAMLWEQLRPLYEHLHAYVRRQLIIVYGNDRIKEDGPIPAHLFGNMWAQSWVSLLDISQPFPGKPSVDVTSVMEAKNMTALEMFKISEEFFSSLGLKPMPEEFWKHSLIEKPKDREIICHASAWDFCNGKDYRIKQCTDITMEDLFTVHHEMGHIQYFLQYARQPNVFREGANPGFHEAIGDVLSLSVSTPNHLKSIGLLEEVSNDPEGDLNFLFRIALEKVSFLPSGYLIDLWRWGLFSGEFTPEEMNSKWWELRLKYQGICPPVKRTESDFDPGAKYHVPGNVPYIRYFVSFVIQFQFHKVLCDASGHTGPLHKCDIYRSKEAGQILSQVMELGSSEHWSEAMKIMTGGATSKMDASPILEYFEPLLQYLIEQNRNETIGWKSNDPTICP